MVTGGIVRRFSFATLWGVIETDETPPRLEDFHGTCISGGFAYPENGPGVPTIGERVRVIRNQWGRLFSVEIVW